MSYAKTIDYKIVSGDTLYIIAKKNHTTVKELKTISGLKAGDTLKLGQQIKVPVDTYSPQKQDIKAKSVTVAKQGKNYKVVPGDTLYIVAKKNGTTTSAIREINGMKKGQLIRVGQTLNMPVDAKVAKAPVTKSNVVVPNEKKSNSVKKVPTDIVKKQRKAKVYVVTSGDTLYSIAKRNNITTDKIRQINGMSKKQLIKVGQSLKVSEGSVTVDVKKSIAKTSAEVPKSVVVSTPVKKSTPKKIEKKKETAVNSSSKKVTYKVVSGDSLSMIAKKYGVTTQQLLDANKMKNKSVRIGQVLKMPVEGAEIESKKDITKTKKIVVKNQISKSKTVDTKKNVIKKEINKIHVVKAKDTLYSIAKNNHVSLKRLLDLNGMRGNYSIKVGQRLKLGKTTVATSKTMPKSEKIAKSKTVKKIESKKVVAKSKKVKLKKYRVKKGDVISVIAKKNNLDLNQLLKLNKMTRRSKLRVGQLLVLNVNEASTSTKTKTEKVAVKTPSATKNLSKNRRVSSALSILNGKKATKKKTKTVARKSKSKRKRRGSNAKVIRTAKRYLGRRYVWGATGPSKFDCSGFTQYVLRKSKGVRLPRVSRQQAYYGKYVSRRNLRAGDLVFFDTSRRRRGYVNHVGIYIGNNQFIHASSARHRVVITSLNRPFYRSRFKWGRRVN